LLIEKRRCTCRT